MTNELFSSFKEANFSRGELQVLQLLIKGLSNKEIAASLQISQKTVEEHLTSIYSKIGVKSRVKAILWGVKQTRGFPH